MAKIANRVRFYEQLYPLLGLVLLFAATMPLVHADEQAGWLGGGAPTLIKEFDLATGDTLPTTAAGLGNRDCQDQTVVTRPARLFQSQTTATACFVETAFGVAESNGLIRFSGAVVAGQSANYSSYLPGFIAVPSSFDVIHYTSAGTSGLFLHVTRNLPNPLMVTTSLNGVVSYRFAQAGDNSLRDKAGTLLAAQTDSLSFSSNGKWLVVDSPGRAMLRVNLDTLETVPFASPFNYTNGIAPLLQTAVSNDGRYVAVASKNYSAFRLYDLATCGAVPDSITAPVNCQFRDLFAMMQGQLPSFIGAFNLRFTSSTILSLYSISSPSGVTKRAKFSLLAPGETRSQVAYLGMGDSFASGEGDNLGGTYYEPGTDEDVNKCHLSRRSYPYLIKNALNVSSFHSVACSGAVIDDVTMHPQDHHGIPTPNPLGAWLPGIKKQTDYLIGSTNPNFLTISIGGNDVGFADVITECATSHFKIPLPTTCRYAANISDRANTAKQIANQYARLKTLYEQLIKITNSKTRIYVIGYPKFVRGEGSSCGVNVRLNDQERQFVDKSTTYLNQVIKAAADASGAYYLDVEDALEGRNLCSIVSDQAMAVNGLTEGNDKHLGWWGGYLIGGISGIVATQRLGLANESFHPNSTGQQLLGDRVLALTNNDPGSFVTCPSQPTTVICKKPASVPLPDVAYFGSDAVSYASSLNTPSPTTQTTPPTRLPMITPEATDASQVHIQLRYVLPGSVITISLEGPQTVSLGQYSANQQGVVDVIVPIAPSVTPGIQSLRVTGTNIAGEPRDYYQSIFVPGPDGDINANNVPDTQEVCGFSPPSGIDVDSDGIDDACDGTVTIPPSPKVTFTMRNLSAHAEF